MLLGGIYVIQVSSSRCGYNYSQIRTNIPQGERQGVRSEVNYQFACLVIFDFFFEPTARSNRTMLFICSISNSKDMAFYFGFVQSPYTMQKPAFVSYRDRHSQWDFLSTCLPRNDSGSRRSLASPDHLSPTSEYQQTFNN